jgi:hypothetical protein
MSYAFRQTSTYSGGGGGSYSYAPNQTFNLPSAPSLPSPPQFPSAGGGGGGITDPRIQAAKDAMPIVREVAPYVAIGVCIVGVGYYLFTAISGSTFGGSLAKSTAGFAGEAIKETARQLPDIASEVIGGVWDSFGAIGDRIDPEGKVGEFFKELGEASYPRGAGKVPSLNVCPPGFRTDPLTCFNTSTWEIRGRLEGGGQCEKGWQNDAGLCYPICKQGYYGVGPACWKDKVGIYEAASQVQGVVKTPETPQTVKALSNGVKKAGLTLADALKNMQQK